MTSLEFFDKASDFLEAAGEYLAKDPVVSTVVATTAERAAVDVEEGLPSRPDDWYVAVRGSNGEVAGVAMRTAPFAPRPLFLLPMPEQAAVELAHVLRDRGEQVEGANGALPGVSVFATELGRLTGRISSVSQRMRLFDLHDPHELQEPDRLPAGALRAARAEEADLCLSWFQAFTRDADEQAGRSDASDHDLGEDRESMRRRIETGRLWLWEVEGEVVHLTQVSPPAFGVSRIGPVYTPRTHRGHGYASAAVAQVTRRTMVEGVRPCLFTDQDNPTSNAIYERLGYRRVVDMANVVLKAQESGDRA